MGFIYEVTVIQDSISVSEEVEVKTPSMEVKT